MKYPNEYKVRNISKEIKNPSPTDIIKVRVPGSKSITNRNLLLAALSDGECLIKNVLFSDDSRHFMNCLKELGFKTEINEEEKCVRIEGCGGSIPKAEADIYVGSAGTAARFLTALLGLSQGSYHMNCSEQMKKRPMAELLKTLNEVGARIIYDEKEGCFPYTIGLTNEGIKNRQVCVNIDASSQFLSALLISAVKLGGESAAVSEEASAAVSEEASAAVSEEASAAVFEEASAAVFDEASAAVSDVSSASAAGCGTKNNSDGLTIEVTGSHGMAYIDMTIELMKMFGASVEVNRENSRLKDDNLIGEDDRLKEADAIRENSRLFYKVRHQTLKAGVYETEADMSAAAYFYAAAAILGISVMVYGVHENSLQGDVEFLHILERMGATLYETEEGIVLRGPEGGRLKGIEADMHACSDQAITLAAVAVFADSPVTIKGIGHIRYQECDRMAAIVSQLKAMGIDCEMGEDFIRIIPGSPKPCVVETFEDHRMAMGFSLTGLKSDGIVIGNPGCCAKTFENYFEVLEDFADRAAR